MLKGLSEAIRESGGGQYLLNGRDAGFVKRAAQKLARAFICVNGNRCGRCSLCAAPPAVLSASLIETAERPFVIDSARALKARLALKPMLGAKRAVIINDIDEATPEAQNALLKILEEPPAGTLFILTARSLRSILATVISRTQVFSFTGETAETDATPFSLSALRKLELKERFDKVQWLIDQEPEHLRAIVRAWQMELRDDILRSGKCNEGISQLTKILRELGSSRGVTPKILIEAFILKLA